MAKKVEAKPEKKNRSEVVIAVLCVSLLLLSFAVICAVLGSRTVGKITYDGEVRVGKATIFTFETDKPERGDVLTWFVDNKRAASYRYGEGSDFCYVPQHTGKVTIRAAAGKFHQSVTVEVKKPLLKIVAEEETITYGQQPQLRYRVEGLLKGDTLQSLGIEVKCLAQWQKVGAEDICFEPVACDKYEVLTQSAKLTVLPCKLTVRWNKTYDGTDKMPETLCATGAKGEKVFLTTGGALPSKNAGSYRPDVTVTGQNAANYTAEVICTVLPKRLTLHGLRVKDKKYDGTTKAELECPGTLQGVILGDSVAIGEMEVAFDSAAQGERKVTVKKVSLVGLDKQNYTVDCAEGFDAHILPR